MIGTAPPPNAPMMSTASVSSVLVERKHYATRLFLAVLAGVVVVSVAVAFLQAALGIRIVLALLGAVGLGLVVVRWPIAGLYTAAGCVVLIEQDALLVHDFTDQLYIFTWPTHLQGLPDRPIGFLFLYVVAVLVIRNLAQRKPVFAGGALLLPFLAFLACVALGIAHGLSSGGTLKSVVIEVRPLWYLFITYVLAFNLIEDKRHVRNFFWIVIAGAGIKGLQGVYIIFTAYSGHLSGQNEIMAHEESFFFVGLLLLILLFCLHHRDRRQLMLALCAVPFVVPALLANNRRADYVALLLGIAVAWILVIVTKPQHRKGLIFSFVICVALGGAYVVAFGNQSGSFAQPAHAIVSVIHPSAADARDVASNYYRIAEDFDLKYTFKQSPIIGYGFGKEFLQPIVLPDISLQDPVYLIVPHNTVYWILMRLGILGYGAFWYLIGAMMVRGCLIVRRLRDPYLQMVGIFAVSAIVMEIAVAYADYQLYFYRNVIYFGLLVGLLMKLPALDSPTPTPPESNVDVGRVKAHTQAVVAQQGSRAP